MRIAFFGTSEIGSKTLCALHNHFGIEIVITTPDKVGKRNKQLCLSPIKSKATELGLNVLQPSKLTDKAFLDQINDYDIGILFSYGKIIPKQLIDKFKYGILNIHPSILPKYRGASPIISAILNNDSHTGVSIIELTQELDAGDILMQKIIPIDKDDDNLSLSDKISSLSSQIILCAVEFRLRNHITPYKQKGVPTYTRKFSKQDALIDFTKDNAQEVVQKVKAFIGYLDAYFIHDNKIYKVLKADVVERNANPGTVVESTKNSYVIACKTQAVSIKIIKPEGKKAMPIEAFLAGNRLDEKIQDT